MPQKFGHKRIVMFLSLFTALVGRDALGEERKFAVMLAVPRKTMPASYPDPKKPLPNPYDVYDHYFDISKPGVDSFAEYFNEVSYGNVHVTGNVLGWVEIPWRILPASVVSGKKCVPTLDLNGGNFTPFTGEKFWEVSGGQPAAQMYRYNCDPSKPETCALGDGWWTPGERFRDLNGNGKYDGAVEPVADGFAAIIKPGDPTATPPVDAVCDAKEPDGKIENTMEFCDFDGDGIWDVPEPFEDFLRVYEPVSQQWVKLDPSVNNKDEKNRAWAEAYIRSNYPGDADALIARCGNGRYDGPDPWAEQGTSKMIARVGTGASSPNPELGLYPWNYGLTTVPNQPVWWDEYWKDMHLLAGVANPPLPPPAPLWQSRPGTEAFDPTSVTRPFAPNVGGTKARSTASCTPDANIKDCNNSTAPSQANAGDGSVNSDNLIHTGGDIYPDTEGYYDGPAEFTDLPSSVYHTRQAIRLDPLGNPVLVGPSSGIGYGGDGRFGEVTSPTSDAESGEDIGTGDPGSAGGPDGRIPAAGPLAYNIHGTNGYDAGNVMPLEFATWIHEPAYGSTKVLYATSNADGTPNPSILKRDYNLDGLIDVGEVRLPGTENYAYDTAASGTNDGGPSEMYPFNRRRLTEDTIEALDSTVDWDHLITTYGNQKYLFSTVLLPGGIYPDGLACGGRGLFQLPAPGMNLPVNTRDLDPLEAPMFCSDFATALAKPDTDGKDTNGYQKALLTHEFLHVWEGYPDLYDYDEYINGYVNSPVDIWDVMARGWVHPCPFLKEFGTGNHSLGIFHTPWIQTTDLRTVLQPLEKKKVCLTDYAFDAAKASYYYEKSADPGERFYFWRLTRERSTDPKKVNFSKDLPGDGMMIMHTDAGQNPDGMPAQNRLSTHFTYNIVQADGLQELDNGELEPGKDYAGDAGDPWPGTTNARQWNSDTDPNSRWWQNTPSGISILDIEDLPDRSMVTFLWEPRLVPELKFLRPPGGTITNSNFNLNYEAFDFFGGTQIEFYFDRDSQGYDGTLINTVALAKSIPELVQSTFPVPLSALPGDGPYFFYARLIPGKGVDSKYEPAASVPEAGSSNRGLGHFVNALGQPDQLDVDVSKSLLEAWNVTCVDARVPGEEKWQVRGTTSGPLPELAQTGAKYTPASGQISFTIVWDGQVGNATVSNQDGVFTLEDPSPSEPFAAERFRTFDVVRIVSGPAPGLYPIKAVLSPTRLELAADAGNGLASYRLNSFKAEDGFGPPDQFIFLTTGKTAYSRPIRIEHGKLVPEMYAVIKTTFSDEAINPLHRAPVTVVFDASDSRDELGNENLNLTYSWDFGDGSPVATGRLVQHTYMEPFASGVTVTLTATNPTPWDDPFTPEDESLVPISSRATATLAIPPLADNLNFVFENDPVLVPEKATAPLNIKLSEQPPRDVTVTARVATGSSITLGGTPPSLTFTPTNWNQFQAFDLAAMQYSGTTPQGVKIELSAPGLYAQTVDALIQAIVVQNSVTSVPEAGTGTVRVRLAAPPQGDVVVTCARTSGDTSLSLKEPPALTFTPANWDQFQEFVIAAAEDLDASNGTASFQCSATGLTPTSFTAVEQDNDLMGITVLNSPVTVPEGGTAELRLALSAQPLSSTVVTVSRQAGDPDISVQAPATVTFTPGNWNSPQSVTLSAAEDADAASLSATLKCSSAGMPDVQATALEQDNDVQTILADQSRITVPEDGKVTLRVKLSAAPTGDLTVTTARTSGDSDLVVESGATLVFTPANWNSYQLLTIAAIRDNDRINGQAVFRCSAPGAVACQVEAAELDNTPLMIVLDRGSIIVPEGASATFGVRLNAEPDANLSVTVERVEGDPSLSFVPASLQFTRQNWNIAQTVTVSAAEDADGSNGSAVFRCVATGAYQASITATEQDNDSQQILLESTALSVAEGGSAQVRVKLNIQPDTEVRVSAVAGSGDRDIQVATPSLTFTRANWSTWQYVKITASEDIDAGNGSNTVLFKSAGLPEVSLSVTEQDNDRQMILCPANLTVSENTSMSLAVTLQAQPISDVTVNVEVVSGDSDFSVVVGNTLVFSASNWHINHIVTIAAGEDGDKVDGQAVLRLSAPGVESQTVHLTERDNDPNVGPTARAGSVTVAHASAQVIQLDAEDSDRYPQDLTYVLVDQPDHGQITQIDSRTGELVYVPSSQYAGADSFTFKVSDGLAESVAARISIVVQAGPTPPGDEPPGDEPPATNPDPTGNDDTDDTTSPTPDQRGDADNDLPPVVTAPTPCGAGLMTAIPMIVAGLAWPRVVRRRATVG